MIGLSNAIPVKLSPQVYTNKCSMKGCKKKEMIPISCPDCGLNFCLTHRHGPDHKCQGRQGGRAGGSGPSGYVTSFSTSIKINSFNKPTTFFLMICSRIGQLRGSRIAGRFHQSYHFRPRRSRSSLKRAG